MKSHAEFIQPCARSAIPRFSLAATLRAAWQQLGRWHALYRQRQQLASLSDEMLKDIGLSRADIETETIRPFWDEPFRRC
ncbi:DUF1127 domain-containing protein [Stutzerimonas xanthomarina]|uniref:DUF1127 domain-containing protein n=1 Tax=Stutzerimonas xanthomarina TaxID=271420 RepID=UPI003AA7E3C5